MELDTFDTVSEKHSNTLEQQIALSDDANASTKLIRNLGTIEQIKAALSFIANDVILIRQCGNI